MKKILVLAVAFAVAVSFSASGCNSGKTQKNGNVDSAAVDSVKDTTAVESAGPKVSVEEAKASATEACEGLFNYAMSMEVTGAYDYMTPGLRGVFEKIDDYQNRTGEIVLDYDPILGAQDYPESAKPVLLSFELKSDTEAVGEVQVWKGHNRTLTFKEVNGKWLVDDVSGERANLEKLVKGL